MRKLFVIGAIVLSTGCGEPRLDGSSEKAMKESAAKITSSLDGEKKQLFQDSVQLITISQVDMKAVMSGQQNYEDVRSGMMSALDGKTADEVIAKAEQIKAEREAREKAQALEEIAELDAKLASADAARVELAKFEVVRSRFKLEKQQYSYRLQPVIEISVKNGTAGAISRAYFRGTIATPGRSVPWLVKDFNYSIPGGLEPGESADWALEPNMFSEWSKVEAPADAVFTAEVVRLDGADSKALFDARGLSESETERLEKLRAKYPNK